MAKKTSFPSRKRVTHEQPFQDVMSRWREPGGGGTSALLACGHIEAATGKDLWNRIRCQTCNPVRKPDAPPLPQNRDPFIR
jgi:hypothetical protein